MKATVYFSVAMLVVFAWSWATKQYFPVNWSHFSVTCGVGAFTGAGMAFTYMELRKEAVK